MKAVSVWCISLFHATGSLQLDLVDMHLETSENQSFHKRLFQSPSIMCLFPLTIAG